MITDAATTGPKVISKDDLIARIAEFRYSDFFQYFNVVSGLGNSPVLPTLKKAPEQVTTTLDSQISTTTTSTSVAPPYYNLTEELDKEQLEQKLTCLRDKHKQMQPIIN